MIRPVVLLCAFAVSGCNAVLSGASAPMASAPPAVSEPGVIMAPPQATAPMGAPAQGEPPGVIVPPPLADLDCAPRTGAITCS